jgi:transposase
MKMTTVLAAALLAVVAWPASAQVDRDGHQRWLDIENRSGMTIREAYMTDVDTPNWGDDRLGADVVPSGNRYRMLPNARQRARGYCRYDVRLIWQNGQAWERRSINLCEATALNCTGVGVCGVR